jgi:hypothetical protein
MILAILFIISVVIYFYLKRKGKFPYQLTKHLYNEKLLLNILLIWIVIGFFLSLDYSDQWGCIIEYQPFWSKLNILFSFISFALVLIAKVVKNKKMRVIFLFLELFFWIGKLMVYKGGYSVGFVGSPQTLIVCYDLVALFLRLLVLRNTFFKIRTIYIASLTVIVLLVKISFFRTQQTIEWEYERGLKNSELTLQKIQGDWQGERIYEKVVFDTIFPKKVDTVGKKLSLLELVELENKDTIFEEKRIKHSEPISLHVDSNLLMFKLGETSLNYIIAFNYEYSATIFELHDSVELNDITDYYAELMELLELDSIDLRSVKRKEIYIRKIDTDSLVIEEWLHWNETYKLKKK